MQDSIDINLLIQVYNEKLNQLSTEIIIKETIIKQLSHKIEELELNNKEN